MIAQVKKLAMLVAAIQRTENIMYLWGRILQQKCDKDSEKIFHFIT